MDFVTDWGLIAGIGGLALGVLLILFREVIRKKIFPVLTEKQGFQIIIVFMLLVWSASIFCIYVYYDSGKSRPAIMSKEEIEKIKDAVKEPAIKPFVEVPDSIIEPGKDKQILIDETNNWCKEGYFISHNSVNVNVIDLNENTKTVIFKLDDLGSTEIITPFMLRPGDEKVIKAGKREYQIRLVKIDKAGIRKKTKAAYFDLKVWED
jgi:hypothetical protein